MNHTRSTATEATPGDVNEGHLLVSLLEQHQETLVADSKYGTSENFLACSDPGVRAHLPALREAAVQREAKRGIFPEERFSCAPETDRYLCPAGNSLKPKSLHLQRQGRDYAAPRKVCAACPLREPCTKNRSGRTIKRHLRQEDLDRMRKDSHSAPALRDLRTRKHLMERFFACSKRYGYDRARWRGLWRMQIQDDLTLAIQNIRVLIREAGKPRKWAAARGSAVKRGFLWAISPLVTTIQGLYLGPIRHGKYFFQRT